MFRIFLANKQCKHIIFAGLHDNGYLNILKPYEHDIDTSSRITLLETLPAQPEYKTLGLKIISFENVFRNTSFVWPSSPAKIAAPRPISTTSSAATLSSSPSMAPIQRTDSASYDSSSWATATKSGAHVHNISIASTKPSAPAPGTFYYCNAASERIDDKLPFLKNSDREELRDFTKTTKLCNQHYLGGYCPKKSNCPFSHKAKLSSTMLLALRHQARNIACKQGLQCYDEACYFGHSCPTEVRNGHCDHGNNCYFYKVHGVDLVSARNRILELKAC
jgi:hypothetical protein